MSTFLSPVKLAKSLNTTDTDAKTKGENVIKKRVIGGIEYDEGKWPWLVSLQGDIPEIKVKLVNLILK